MDMDQSFFWVTLTLFFSGLFAGWIDAMAGGGGLITLPVLLHVGVPPAMALGTNKFQSSFGSFTSSYKFVKAKKVNLKNVIPGILCTIIGALFGVSLAKMVNSQFLSMIIPFMMLGIVLYLLLAPTFPFSSAEDLITSDTTSKKVVMVFVVGGIVLGFYDGFFGPGTGNFWTFVLFAFAGLNLMEATAHTKIFNFTSNIIAFLLFAISGKVLYKMGLIMAMGQIIGSRIGAGMVINRGSKFIRPIFITVVIFLALTLLYKAFFK